MTRYLARMKFGLCMGFLLGGGLIQGQAQTLGALTPAHEAALKFMRGINFANSLEYAPGNLAGGLTYSSEDFALARAEGFDHVRVPVAWHLYAGFAPDFIISSSIFGKVDNMVNLGLAHGLAIIIDLHHFDDFTTSPSANKNEFYALWKQISAHYAGSPSTVAFELLNEPKDNATTAVMNPIYVEAIRQIRITNPNRTIFVGPGNFNDIDELPMLALPSTDKNLIVTVHCYDPFPFTHQGASWAGPDVSTLGVIFPGPPAVALQRNPKATSSWVVSWFRDYNVRPTQFNPSSAYAFRSKMQRARLWSEQRGRPVHVGEFGAYQTADDQSRVNFYREIRTVMDQQGLGWAMWDWKAGFHYIQNGQPNPAGLREALFPPLTIATPAGGTLEFDAAKGKTFVVEKTLSLLPPAWQSISTQTLLAPKLVFTDPKASAEGAGFYRVRWVK